MASKYDQLSQLKALLDSGTLTQEEFDAAKKRILETEDSVQQPEDERSSISINTPASPKKKNSKWIIIGGVAALVIVSVIIALTANKNDSDSYNASNVEQTASTEEDELAALQEAVGDWDNEPIDGLTIGNPWRKDYFHNEWGEEDQESPYIYTILDGTGWDVHIDYIPPTSEFRWGAFRFWLLDNDGRLTSSYGPVNILVRGFDGETNSIEVTGTRDGITFIEEPASIETLKHYLDQESFDIRMEFEKYNERHSTQARWNASDGSLLEAIDKLL